jgi:hypothetical protein
MRHSPISPFDPLSLYYTCTYSLPLCTHSLHPLCTHSAPTLCTRSLHPLSTPVHTCPHLYIPVHTCTYLSILSGLLVPAVDECAQQVRPGGHAETHAEQVRGLPFISFICVFVYSICVYYHLFVYLTSPHDLLFKPPSSILRSPSSTPIHLGVNSV